MLSGPGRFDCRIQSQQVCLPGNLFNNGYFSCNIAHCRNGFGHGFTSGPGIIGTFDGNSFGLHGIIRILANIGSHLLHGTGGFFRGCSLLRGPLTHLFRTC